MTTEACQKCGETLIKGASYCPECGAEGGIVRRDVPGVLVWFRVYTIFLSLLYLLVIGLGVFFLMFGSQLPQNEEMDDVLNMPSGVVVGLFMIAMGIPLCALFVAPLFLPPRPWVWVFDLVLIGIGCTSACTLPFCIALIIFWIKPETQQYFGRDVKPSMR